MLLISPHHQEISASPKQQHSHSTSVKHFFTGIQCTVCPLFDPKLLNKTLIMLRSQPRFCATGSILTESAKQHPLHQWVNISLFQWNWRIIVLRQNIHCLRYPAYHCINTYLFVRSRKQPEYARGQVVADKTFRNTLHCGPLRILRIQHLPG
ncbi:hypothetical protein BY12_18880 [Escherichia coli O157:H7 str. 2011EL-2091]|nr:hypothetical protein BX36_05755 [Escherichia coli O157:H7 str. 2009EL2109]EYV77290.1 hypothetical protein BY91_17495 [Escherichia coli O157:H7 str. K5806]EYW77117.1 hypothetical protein BY19_26465 [Escherichia coli O157:H7 str. 2011EL-2099]EYW88405.1 hypothetical protein BX03_21230 [Escherichia coli O111:NM str. 08-4487]EYX38702.1 hypothetical protein BY14_20325 [Escherichia coli O157:H7 str. 2011EL-2093]EYX51944.1 hypothetical protein BY12_18880 [Escherichia coli O157:H7 str. 2011EL-2091]